MKTKVKVTTDEIVKHLKELQWYEDIKGTMEMKKLIKTYTMGDQGIGGEKFMKVIERDK